MAEIARYLVGTDGPKLGDLRELPRTKLYLRSALETTGDYQKRKVLWAATTLRQLGKGVNEPAIRTFDNLPKINQKFDSDFISKVVNGFNFYNYDETNQDMLRVTDVFILIVRKDAIKSDYM